MKALIHNKRICQIVEDDEVFPVNQTLKWVDADETITTRHRYVDGEFVSPPETPPETPLTKDEMYDIALARDPVVKALISAINTGALTNGGNKSPAAVKNIIKSRM